MNKIKFLSCAVMAAFFALGTTSCEKENFTPDVNIDAPDIEIPEVVIPEGYKPGDALVSIQPEVFVSINGIMKNVTEDENTTITYNGEETFVPTLNADKGIDAVQVNVVATYTATYGEQTKELSATTIVRVPALTAGQVFVSNPTLIMSVVFEEESGKPGDEQPGGDDEDKVSTGLTTEVVPNTTNVTKNPFEIEFNNNSPYYSVIGNTTINLTDKDNKDVKYGSEISNVKVEAGYADNKEVQEILGAFNQAVTGYKITIKNLTLWPNTKSCFAGEQIIETKNYIIKEGFETRAASEVKAATFTVTDYSYIISTTPEYYDAGHGHTGHGHAGSHGDGHSHGNDNAGGGIVWGI